MRGDPNHHGMRGGTRKKEEGLAESGRVLTSQSDPIGLSQAEAFRNSLADSVSFRFPSRRNLEGGPASPAKFASSPAHPAERWKKSPPLGCALSFKQYAPAREV